jgi:hypothetical protein
MTLIDELERPSASDSQTRPAATEFVWPTLNEDTQVVIVAGAIVAVLYTGPASRTVGDRLEFCRLPVDNLTSSTLSSVPRTEPGSRGSSAGSMLGRRSKRWYAATRPRS